MADEVTKPSPAINVLNQALTQVEEVLAKSEQTQKLLQENLQQVQMQRIAVSAQKQMLVELVNKISEVEKQ